LVEQWRDRIEAVLRGNPLFQLAAQPKRIIGPMFSRYGAGDHYGSHVDDAILDGARSDLSFTLFLAAPESYEGGELTIETAAGDDAYKLEAGSLVLYPATTLHRVAPVTRGHRYAAVGWRSPSAMPTGASCCRPRNRAAQPVRQPRKTADFDCCRSAGHQCDGATIECRDSASVRSGGYLSCSRSPIPTAGTPGRAPILSARRGRPATAMASTPARCRRRQPRITACPRDRLGRAAARLPGCLGRERRRRTELLRHVGKRVPIENADKASSASSKIMLSGGLPSRSLTCA
jgi:hypothetical protein